MDLNWLPCKGCFQLCNRTTSQHNPYYFDELLGKNAREISRIMNYIVVCSIVAISGIVSNIINLLIFAKQGYDNTVNISLSGIAVSDICTLVSIIWFTICANPLFDESDVSVAFSEILYLTAAWPHCLFARITCIITVFITVERFLCVAIPLKIKNVITRTKTIIIVSSLFLSQILTAIPSYYTTTIDWKFFPDKNRSMLALRRIQEREHVESISFVLQATMQAGSFILLIFFTAVLLVHLNKQKKWRGSSTSETRKETISARDKKLVRMVVLIAVILIVCFTPGMVCFTAMALVPDFMMGGPYDNVFWVVWSFPFMFQTANSSVNIFVYYNMSSKYRDTFDETFVRCIRLVQSKKNETAKLAGY